MKIEFTSIAPLSEADRDRARSEGFDVPPGNGHTTGPALVLYGDTFTGVEVLERHLRARSGHGDSFASRVLTSLFCHGDPVRTPAATPDNRWGLYGVVVGFEPAGSVRAKESAGLVRVYLADGTRMHTPPARLLWRTGPRLVAESAGFRVGPLNDSNSALSVKRWDPETESYERLEGTFDLADEAKAWRHAYSRLVTHAYVAARRFEDAAPRGEHFDESI